MVWLPVSEEECSVCRWTPDGHHPDDWQAFAAWNAHLLCFDCFNFAMQEGEVPHLVIMNPEDEYDFEIDEVASIPDAEVSAETDSDEELDPAYEMVPNYELSFSDTSDCNTP